MSQEACTSLFESIVYAKEVMMFVLSKALELGDIQKGLWLQEFIRVRDAMMMSTLLRCFPVRFFVHCSGDFSPSDGPSVFRYRISFEQMYNVHP